MRKSLTFQVTKDDASGAWDMVCTAAGCGFRSTNWPTKALAVSRGEEHFREHATGELMRPMHEVLTEAGFADWRAP